MKDYFAKETVEQSWYPGTPTEMQVALWLWQKEHHLNPIRRHVGCPVYLTSCGRTLETFTLLLERGYHPSPTSDHFALQAIPISDSYAAKQQKYGAIYQWATFASDITGNFDVMDLCRDIYLGKVEGMGDVKQLIAESQLLRGRRVHWVHISVPYSAIYTPEISKAIMQRYPKEKYLKTTNGATYERTDFS